MLMANITLKRKYSKRYVIYLIKKIVQRKCNLYSNLFFKSLCYSFSAKLAKKKLV